MKKILFVDDESNVLNGYRRILRPLRGEWEMSFANGGGEAIEMFREEVFDVIVTDVKMPEIDGVAVLQAAHEHRPEAILIVLSGHAELEQTVGSVSIAHQFLSKPCVPEILRDTVDRAARVRSMLGDTELRKLVSRMKSLPTLPATYSALSRALADPEVGISDVAPIVEGDAAVCAKILQLVNSPFFSVSQSIQSINQAMSYVGLDMIKTLVLSSEVFKPTADMQKVPGFSVEGEQQHALLTANIAKGLFDDRRKIEQAFTAGMLHDLGKLVFASQLPRQLAKLLARANKQKRLLSEIEAELETTTHAQVGAYLLGVWGFPYCISEAVLGHHAPAELEHGEFDLVDALHVANVLARRQTLADSDAPCEELDVEHLERLGVADRIPEWEALAEEVTHGGEP